MTISSYSLHCDLIYYIWLLLLLLFLTSSLFRNDVAVRFPLCPNLPFVCCKSLFSSDSKYDSGVDTNIIFWWNWTIQCICLWDGLTRLAPLLVREHACDLVHCSSVDYETCFELMSCHVPWCSMTMKLCFEFNSQPPLTKYPHSVACCMSVQGVFQARYSGIGATINTARLWETSIRFTNHPSACTAFVLLKSTDGCFIDYSGTVLWSVKLYALKL